MWTYIIETQINIGMATKSNKFTYQHKTGFLHRLHEWVPMLTCGPFVTLLKALLFKNLKPRAQNNTFLIFLRKIFRFPKHVVSFL